MDLESTFTFLVLAQIPENIMGNFGDQINWNTTRLPLLDIRSDIQLPRKAVSWLHVKVPISVRNLKIC